MWGKFEKSPEKGQLSVEDIKKLLLPKPKQKNKWNFDNLFTKPSKDDDMGMSKW